MVSDSFIPSVVCGKLAINTVEFNSRKVSCFQLSIYCLCRTTFTMQCVNGQSFLYSMFGLTHVYAEF